VPDAFDNGGDERANIVNNRKEKSDLLGICSNPTIASTPTKTPMTTSSSTITSSLSPSSSVLTSSLSNRPPPREITLRHAEPICQSTTIYERTTRHEKDKENYNDEKKIAEKKQNGDESIKTKDTATTGESLDVVDTSEIEITGDKWDSRECRCICGVNSLDQFMVMECLFLFLFFFLFRLFFHNDLSTFKLIHFFRTIHPLQS